MANSKVKVEITGDNKGLKKSFVESEKVVKTSASNMTDTIVSAGKAMGAAFAAVGTALLAKDIVLLADEYTNLNSRLKLVSKGSEELAELQRELFEISQETGTSYKTNAAAYAKLALSLQELNVSQEEMLNISELVNKSLIVSGATTEEISSFTLQFSQAMGSGVLQGDEFRAMMEANSYFGAKLAEVLNTDISGLRAMSKEGKLTTDVLREAFPAMANEVDEAFSDIPVTIGRAMQEMENAFGMVIDGANKASGGTTSIAEEFHELAETIEENKEGIISFFGSLLSGASQAVEIVANLGQSMAGWAAVGDGRLSILEFAVMDAEELKDWLGKNNNELAELDHQIAQSQGKIKELASHFAISPAARKSRKEAIAAERKHIQALKDKKALLIAMGAAIEDTYTEQGEATAAVKETIEAEEKLAKVIRITTDERYMALQMSKEQAREALKAEEEAARIAEQLAADRATASRNMYGDMEGYAEDYFDAQVVLLNAERAEYERLGIDKIAIEEWYTQKYSDLVDEQLLKTGDFFDGVRLGFEQLLDDQVTWAEAGQDVFSTFADGSAAALSDNLFDIIKGDFDDLGDAWGDLWDTMLKTMVDILAQMAVEWAAAEVVGFVAQYFHDGTTEIKDDEVPAILQQGEMVIPRHQSGVIRDNLGDGADVFDTLATMSEVANEDVVSGGASWGAPSGIDSVGSSFGVDGKNTPAGSIESAFGSALADQYEATAVEALAAAIATGKPDVFFDVMTNPATTFSNVSMAGASLAQDALGMNTPAGNAGFLGAGVMGAALGLGPVGVALAAVAASVALEAAADVADLRDFESFLDKMEDHKGWFSAHYDQGIFGAGHSWEDIVDAGALEEFGEALEEIASGVPGLGDGDEMSNLDTYSDMPDSDDLGDTPGLARFGGMFDGPSSGYPMILHGKEAVVPTPSGEIPVKMVGGGGNNPISVQVFIGDKEIKDDIRVVVDEHVTDRARAGVPETQRVAH